MHAGFSLELPVHLPCDWGSLTRFLDRHATPGLESCRDGVYRRVLAPETPGSPAQGAEVRFDGARMHVTLHGIDDRHHQPVLARLGHLLGWAHDPACLPLVSGIDLGGIRVPGAYAGFETAVCIILGQLVSTAAARRLIGRLVETFGERCISPWPDLDRLFPDAGCLAEADLSGLGIPRLRAGAIRSLAQQVHAGHLTLSRDAPRVPTRRALAAIPGIGPWTVELVAMRCLGDPDAFPATDLVIRREVQRLGIDPLHWSPWRASLAACVWKLHAQALRTKAGTQA